MIKYRMMRLARHEARKGEKKRSVCGKTRRIKTARKTKKYLEG
jgi:hypothetical protein